jgi:hypothetical protein
MADRELKQDKKRSKVEGGFRNWGLTAEQKWLELSHPA